MIGQTSIQHWGGLPLPVSFKGIAFINVHKSHIDHLMQKICILCSIDRLSFSGDAVQKSVHADHKLIRRLPTLWSYWLLTCGLLKQNLICWLSQAWFEELGVQSWEKVIVHGCENVSGKLRLKWYATVRTNFTKSRTETFYQIHTIYCYQGLDSGLNGWNSKRMVGCANS